AGILHLAHALQPPVAREDDGRVLVHDVGLGVVGELLAGRELRAPLVAVLLAQGGELGADHLPALARAGEEGLDLLETLLLLGPLGEDLLDLEAGELVEANVEDRVSLHLVELEGGHQLPGGVGARLGLPDDADDAVEVVVAAGERVQDVEAGIEVTTICRLPRGSDSTRYWARSRMAPCPLS